MMKKRLLTFLTVSGLIAGCVGPALSVQAEEGDVTKTAVGEYTAENPYQLTFPFLEFYPQDEGARQAVEDAMNEFMIPEYHIQVEFLPLELSQYQQTLSLMISGGDKLDILPIDTNQVNTLIGMNGVVDLTPYMDTEEGQKIKDALGEEIAMAGNQNGILYGFAANREFSTCAGLCMRKDVCDELGIAEKYGLDENSDAYTGKIYDWSVAEEIFAQVAEAHPEMTPVYIQGMTDEAKLFVAYDNLMDGFGVLDLQEDQTSTEVVNLYETEEYKEYATMMADWYAKGYIYKDAATDQQGSTAVFKAGNTFSYVSNLKPGFNVQNKMATGIDSYCMYFGKQPECVLSTAAVNFGSTGIATNSEDPEMAFKFIAALYSDPRVMNTWQYGIEGVNYQVLDDGTATYVDGEDGGNFKYHQGTAWSAGNQFIAYVWNDGTVSADYWDQIKDYNKWSFYSPAFGFAWNNSEHQTNLAALQNALGTYRAALETGSVGGVDKVEETLQKLNDALYASGLQDVMDAKQEQLNAWVEERGGIAQTPEENLEMIATAEAAE